MFFDDLLGFHEVPLRNWVHFTSTLGGLRLPLGFLGTEIRPITSRRGSNSSRSGDPRDGLQGLSRLLSAVSIKHDTPGTADRWLCTSEVIGVTRDSKFGEEGGLQPPAFRKLRSTREFVAIAFIAAGFQILLVKRREVSRSAKKPKKWRKTVACSSPNGRCRAASGMRRKKFRAI
jgi:hypothetical protein